MSNSAGRRKNLRPVAIVIGGLGGIGSAIVDNLKGHSVEVVAADRQAKEFPVDAIDEKSVQRLVDQVMRRFNRIDYLVNVAGMFYMKPIEQTSVADWDSMVNLNLKAIFLTSRAIVPIMKKQQFGKMVNIASHAAHKKFPKQVVYKASKAGVVGFSESLDAELRPFNISVDVVSPATVATPGMKASFADRSIDWSKAHTPEEVAEVVWFLLSRPAHEHHFPVVMDHDLVL